MIIPNNYMEKKKVPNHQPDMVTGMPLQLWRAVPKVVRNHRSFTISAYDRWISSCWKPYARSARLSSVICLSAEHKTCKNYTPTSHWWLCLVAFTYPNQKNTHWSSLIPYSWWLNQVHLPPVSTTHAAFFSKRVRQTQQPLKLLEGFLFAQIYKAP